MKKTSNKYQTIKKQSGFTLTEILVALMIVTLMFSAARMSMRDGDLDDLNNHSKKLYQLLELAQEESIIRGIELGVRVEKEKYYFMLYDGERWSPLNDHKLLKEVEFEEPFALYVHVEGQQQLIENASDESEESSDSGKGGSAADSIEDGDEELDRKLTRAKRRVTPQIFILSSGEMNPFAMTIGLERDDEKFYRVKGNHLGEIERTRFALEGHYRQDWDKEEVNPDA